MRLAKRMAAALGVLWMAMPAGVAAADPLAADKAILQALEQRRAEMAGSNDAGIAFLDPLSPGRHALHAGARAIAGRAAQHMHVSVGEGDVLGRDAIAAARRLLELAQDAVQATPAFALARIESEFLSHGGRTPH